MQKIFIILKHKYFYYQKKKSILFAKQLSLQFLIKYIAKVFIIIFSILDNISFQTLSKKFREEMSDSQVNKIHNNILNQISKIYDQYEQKSRLMKEQSNKKTGSTIDKAENQLIKKIESNLQPQLDKLSVQMDKVKNLKGKFSNYVKSCHNSIKNILKKRPFNFKINKQILELYDQTMSSIQQVRSKISVADQTTFMCCGVDGKKQFQSVINIFRIQSGKWEMIQILESKGSVDNFISPQFNPADFSFMKEILRANWPKEKQAQVIVKQVQKQKIVTKVVNAEGQKNPLYDAIQYIYGVNRQQNPYYGLNVFHKEADQNNNAQACAFLGSVYEQGVLLPRNLAKATSYYKRAMDSKHKYATYRFALCFIKGVFSKNGQNLDDIKKGFSILNEITNGPQPSPQAIAQLGYIYENGCFSEDKDSIFKVERDLKKAISLNQKARSLYLPRAINNLGLLYFNNKQMNPTNPNEKIQNEAAKVENTKKALSYFYEAQKYGYPQAYFNLGIIHKQQKEHQKAYQYFYQGGMKGDYLSKIKFAYELMNQTSIQKQQYQDHYRLAAHWLQGVIHQLEIEERTLVSKSALDKKRLQKGEALYYLGLLFEHGFGVQKSPKRAFNYFLQASEISYPQAKNKIGDCYFSGYGVTANRQLAIGCYLEAVELSNSDSMVNLGTIYLNGIPNIIERNYNKAHEYFCKAMQLQNSDAMIHLSYMYRNGLGLDSDDELAKKLLEQAAKNKNSTALYMLKERGQDFNKNILYDNLENQFFSPPKRLDITEVVPLISGIN